MEFKEFLKKDEKESFQNIVEYISYSFLHELEKSINHRVDISRLRVYIYREFRKTLLPILVQDINEWRISANKNLDHEDEYVEYCTTFFKKDKLSNLKNNYELLDYRIQKIRSAMITNLSNFLISLERYGIEIASQFNLKRIVVNEVKVIDFIGDNHGLDQNIIFEMQGKQFFYKLHGFSVAKLVYKLQRILNTETYMSLPKSFLGNHFMIQECVEPSPVLKETFLRNYYTNMGALLAFLYMLNGNDFHNENIIAMADVPTIIDIETMINPIGNNLDSMLENSVFAVGMLPMKYNVNFEGILDSSSLGQCNLVSEKCFQECDSFTSKVRLKLVDRNFKDTTKHLPSFNNRCYEVNQYLTDVQNGFKTEYQRLQDKKEEIIKFLQKSDIELQCRLVLRNTRVYSEILKYISSPKWLKSKEKTQEYLRSILSRPRYIVKDIDKYIDLEIKQLIQGEIPYFTFGNQGNVKVEDTDLISIYDSVLLKLNNFSNEDLNFQLELISTAFNIANHNFSTLHRNNMYSSIKKWIAESCMYGRYFTLQKDWCGNYIYDEMHNGLYEGLLGLSLADEEFYSSTNNKNVLNSLKNTPDLSFIDGRASFEIFCRIFNNPQKPLDFECKKLKNVDLIEGVGGFILSRYYYYLEHKEEMTKELHHLLNLFFTQASGLKQLRYGFAHGISGMKIIYYLGYIFLDNYSCFERFEQLENLDIPSNYREGSWCNGLLGWMISEYILFKITNQYEFLDKIIKQIPTLLKAGYKMDDYCLCHGSFGILDFLFTLQNEGLLDKEWNLEYRRFEQYVFDNLENKELLKKDISLFTGIAGILYYLNRKNSCSKSVLTFAF